jgi:hypothetical protein
MNLSVAERSSVILMDVLGYSLLEIGSVTGTTLAATKAALHRGRLRLREFMRTADNHSMLKLTDAERRLLERYTERFNARDFDAIRDMLADEVRLDLVSRKRMTGRKEVESTSPTTAKSLTGTYRSRSLTGARLSSCEILAILRVRQLISFFCSGQALGSLASATIAMCATSPKVRKLLSCNFEIWVDEYTTDRNRFQSCGFLENDVSGLERGDVLGALVTLQLHQNT